MNYSIIMTSVLLGLVAAHPLQAEVFKWQDENGVTHFGDRPPSTAGATSVDVRASEPTAADRAAARERFELARRREQAHERAAKQTRQDSEAADAHRVGAAQACLQARRDWDILGETMRVYRDTGGDLHLHLGGDTYKGPRVYLDEAARREAKDVVRRAIERHCARPDDPVAQAQAREIQIRAEWCESVTARLQAAQRPRSRTTRSDLQRFQERVDFYCD